jgi:hypothetical protein
MAGSINQVESKAKPFRLMLSVMKAFQGKVKVQQFKTENRS